MTFQLEKDRAAFATKKYDYEEYSTGINAINSFEPHNQALEPDFNSKFMEDDIGRYKRQSFLKEEENNLDSLVTHEPLLVEDPQGWGLAHVLGEFLSTLHLRISDVLLLIVDI